MPFITVTQGGPDIEPGTYSVVLKAIEGPKTIYPKSGPNANEAVTIFDWTFVVTDGETEGQEISATTSTSSGPRSKMYAWLTALLGGAPPAVGQSFEVNDLVGREAIATVSRSETGWPRIEQLSALPRSMRAPRRPAPMAQVPQQQAQPQSPIPVAAPVAAQAVAQAEGEDGAPAPF